MPRLLTAVPKDAPKDVRRTLEPLLGLLIGAFVLGPALAPGFVLTYDMVFVPHPPATPAMFGLTGGFPRPVPSDAVVAAIATVLPAALVQKLVLLSIFVLAGWGAARLVPSSHAVPRLTAAAFYGWNPFVAERLVLGQWALLLGYAGLPWVLGAAATARGRPRDERDRASGLGGVARLTRAMLPAAVGGFAAMNLAVLVGVCGALTAPAAGGPRPPGGPRLPVGQGLRGAALVVVVAAGLSLPWLVPAVLRSGGDDGTDPAGVAAFAARADTPFGSVGSLISLGGVWNAEAVPPGYATWFGASLRLALSLVAIAGFATLLFRADGGSRRVDAGGEGRAPYAGLALAAIAGLLVACLGITEPGRAVLRRLVELWPGFGVLRDAQVYIAPLALLEAVGLGVVAALTLRYTFGLLLIAPLALLPGLGWGVAGRLAAVPYPADWIEARRIVSDDPVPGAVLSLPWAAHRRLPWNGGRTTLDPAPRMLPRRVVWNDGLRVGNISLSSEDPAARAAARLLDSPGALAGRLRAAGYRYVVLQKIGSPEEALLRSRLSGTRKVLDGPDLAVYQLDRPARFPRSGSPHATAVISGDVVTVLLTLWSFGATGSNLLKHRRTRK